MPADAFVNLRTDAGEHCAPANLHERHETLSLCAQAVTSPSPWRSLSYQANKDGSLLDQTGGPSTPIPLLSACSHLVTSLAGSRSELLVCDVPRTLSQEYWAWRQTRRVTLAYMLKSAVCQPDSTKGVRHFVCMRTTGLWRPLPYQARTEAILLDPTRSRPCTLVSVSPACSQLVTSIRATWSGLLTCDITHTIQGCGRGGRCPW